MIALDAIELLRFSLAFVTPIRTSYGEERSREGTLVRAITADGVEGWGECAALARPDYHHEFADGAFAAMSELAPMLLRREPLPFDQPMARCALELAALDAELRSRGESFMEHLGGNAMSVSACAAVGIRGELPAGYSMYKLKVGSRDDLRWVADVRASVNESRSIAIDANGAFTVDDVDALRALAELDLLFIEQPFAEPMRVDLGTPICLDESIVSYDIAMRALDDRTADVISIKAPRLGGYLEAKRLHDACRERGVPAWCGGMYDAGISKAANLALAALPGFIGGDLASSSRYFDRDVTSPIELEPGGVLRIPSGPGLGVEPEPDMLDLVVTHRAMIRR